MKQLVYSILIILSIAFHGHSTLAKSKIISWEDLSPAKDGVNMIFDGTGEMRGIPDVSEFDGSKEILDQFLDDMKYVKESQGENGLINIKLNGKRIKIAGYITPIAFDGENITEFLFVPYRGACIHVPPPPANQIIYVKEAKGLKAYEMWSPFWITGILDANSISTIVADVGYSIKEATVSPYNTGLFGTSLFD
ncbi:MAG: DUF3299 domain-containing protein [Rhodospirillales bacterium]